MMAATKKKLPVWRIPNADEETRQLVRVYAVTNKLTNAQAIAQLVRKALGVK